MRDRVVNEKIAEVQDDDKWRTLGITVLSLGIALVAAIPTGGSSLAAGAAVTAELAGLAVDAYLVRLAAVARALTLAEQAYGGPLAELADLRALLDVYHAKAAGTGHADHPEVAEMYKQALAVVGEVPADLPRGLPQRT